MPHPPSFTELDIAITNGDVKAFEDAVEKAKSALTDLAKNPNPFGATLPSLSPSSPPAGPAPLKIEV